MSCVPTTSMSNAPSVPLLSARWLIWDMSSQNAVSPWMQQRFRLYQIGHNPRQHAVSAGSLVSPGIIAGLSVDLAPLLHR